MTHQRAGPLIIYGREARSGRTFTQWIGLGVGDGQYPSPAALDNAHIIQFGHGTGGWHSGKIADHIGGSGVSIELKARDGA